MKKSIKVFVNIFIVVGFIWTALAGVYILAVPDNIKELLPEMNWAVALVSGGSTATFSSILIYVKAFLSNSQTEVNGDIEKITTNQIKINEQFKISDVNVNAKLKGIESIIDKLTNEKLRENELLKENLNRINRLIKLQEVDLKSKLTNPYIDNKEEIEGVLNEEQVNL